MLTWLKILLVPKFEVQILFTSGNNVKVICTKFSVIENYNGNITRLEWETCGGTSGKIIFIDSSKIEFIDSKAVPRWKHLI